MTSSESESAFWHMLQQSPDEGNKTLSSITDYDAKGSRVFNYNKVWLWGRLASLLDINFPYVNIPTWEKIEN